LSKSFCGLLVVSFLVFFVSGGGSVSEPDEADTFHVDDFPIVLAEGAPSVALGAAITPHLEDPPLADLSEGDFPEFVTDSCAGISEEDSRFRFDQIA